MYYGLIMRVKTNGKFRQFGVLDQYGNVLKMTHSELLKHTRKGNVVNLAPNGDFFTGKNCSITDIPIFDEQMNQVGGVPYDSYFNVVANEIYKQTINAEQKSLMEEQEKQLKEQQEQEKQAQKQEQQALVSLVNQEKQEQDAIDKSIEAMGKLGSMARKEMNKRLNREKYLEYLDRVDHLMNMMEHYGSQCVKAKVITNNKLRQSGATLYNRQMDATTNDAKLNNYILVHGVIEVRNRIAAYYTQARNLIEQELTSKDREFYLNRLSDCKLYVGKIQELHKETSYILKENVAHKEQVEEQARQEKETKSQIDNITRQINVITNSKLISLRYIKGKLGESKEHLKNINDELDSLYKQATQNPEVLEATESLFSNAMQAIVSKEEELEQCHADYEAELEAQKLEEARKEEERKLREEEEKLAAQEKERQAKIISEVRKEYERALKRINDKDDTDLVIQERNNFEQFISSEIQVANSDDLIEKLNKTLELLNTKVEDRITKLELKKVRDEEERLIEEAKEEERKAKEEAQRDEQQHREEVKQANKERLESANEIVANAKVQIDNSSVENIISIASTAKDSIEYTEEYASKTISKLDSLKNEIDTYARNRINELEELKLKDLEQYKKAISNLIKDIKSKDFKELIDERDRLLGEAEAYMRDSKVEDFWFNSNRRTYTAYTDIVEMYNEVYKLLDKAEDKQELYNSRLAGREQYVIDYINNLSVADTDEEEKHKISGIERHLVVEDSILGTLDVTDFESIQSALAEYKERCRVAKEEKVLADKKQEAERKVLNYINSLELTDTEEKKTEALNNIHSMCKSLGISIEDSIKIKQAIMKFKKSCEEAINKRSIIDKDIALALEAIANLSVVTTKKECDGNLHKVKSDMSYEAYKDKEVKAALEEYERKCRQASKQLADASQKDMMAETNIKNKLSLIAYDMDIRQANSEEALDSIADKIQNNINKAYKIWSEHWFIDENKGIQCKNTIYNYRDKMQNKLNDKLMEVDFRELSLEDIMDAYEKRMWDTSETSIINFTFQNILKLIHGYFYGKRHSLNNYTGDYEIDLSEDTMYNLKCCFGDAIDILLENITYKDADAFENSINSAFEYILNDEAENGMNFLRRWQVGDDACDMFYEELKYLHTSTLSQFNDFDIHKSRMEHSTRLTIPGDMSDLDDLAGLFQL